MNSRAAYLAVALALSACGGQPPAAKPPLAGARIGGPFALTDQNGKPFTDRDLAGKYRIVYFGYTFCPDVCPIDVQAIGGGLRRFEGEAPALGAKIVPVFVSVDPARDTPAVLKQFVSAFHPRMIGATGSTAAIDAMTKSYGVFYSLEKPGPGGGYLVEHSRQAYLMDPDGAPIALLPADRGPDKVADELARWVK